MANATDRVTALELGPPAPADEFIADYHAKCMEKLGFIPNVFKAYAFDATKLRAFIAMSDDLMLGKSGLSKLEREMIAVAVSATNHCHYCLTSHGWAVRLRADNAAFGETIAQNYRAANLDRRQRAMLDFAVKLTEQPDRIEDSDRQNLRDAGFADRDIWDVIAVASFFNMSNRLATAAAIEPNRDYHHLARDVPRAPPGK